MKKIVLAIGLAICSLTLWAQKEIKFMDVDIINDGEGRLYCFYKSDKSLVDGTVRLIDGYRSQYIETEFKAGYATGTWKSYDDKVLVTEGNYKDGYPNGTFKEYYGDKQLKSQKTFVDGKLDGKVINYYQNGKIYTETEFSKGVENGIDRRYDETGKITSDSKYINGKQTGKSVQQITSNIGDYELVSNYKDGLLDGDYAEIFTDGVVKAKGKYTGGKKTGQWEYNKANGNKQPTEVYDNTGDLIKKTTYYTNGKVEIEREMKDGKDNGVTRKYDNEGKLKSEINYKNGKEDGKYMMLYTSTMGNYKAIGNYTNGKLNGDYAEEYENGKPKAKGKYANGSKTGKWTYYKKDGSVEREETL